MERKGWAGGSTTAGGTGVEAREERLAACKVGDLDELIGETVPEGIRAPEALDFGTPLSERGGMLESV